MTTHSQMPERERKDERSCRYTRKDTMNRGNTIQSIRKIASHKWSVSRRSLRSTNSSLRDGSPIPKTQKNILQYVATCYLWMDHGYMDVWIVCAVLCCVALSCAFFCSPLSLSLSLSLCMCVLRSVCACLSLFTPRQQSRATIVCMYWWGVAFILVPRQIIPPPPLLHWMWSYLPLYSPCRNGSSFMWEVLGVLCLAVR